MSRARSRFVTPAAGWPCGRDPAAAHDRDPVRDRDDLVELVADEDDAPAGRGHRLQRPEQVLGLLRREHRGRLVEDEDPGAAVEELQDLDPLLLADAELPDLRPGIDPQPELGGEAGDLGLRAARVEEEARLGEPEQDVLGHGLRRDQREVLVDHPQAGLDRVARRPEHDRPAVEADLALVGPVEAGEDVHQRALAGAVLAEQRVDLAGPQLEVDVVVGEDARETP